MEPITVETKEQLYNASYLLENLQNDIIYKKNTYTLITVGSKVSEMDCGYGNQASCPSPVSPRWTLTVNDVVHTVTSIN